MVLRSIDKMLNDPLSSALSNIMNAEKVGKEFCLTSPSSKVIKKVLEILKKKFSHEIIDPKLKRAILRRRVGR